MIKRLLWGVLSLMVGVGLIISCEKAPDIKTIEAGVVHKAEKVTITDSSGSNVEIPVNVSNIADAWGAHNAIVAMLGAGDKISATTLTEKTKPLLYYVS